MLPALPSLLLLVGLGCAPEGSGLTPPAGDVEGPPESPALGPPMERAIAIQAVTATPLGERSAEDGWGRVVATREAIALDLHAASWPGRALDPVLTVGDRVFRNYSHPGPGILRFVVAEGALLAATDAWTLQYGDDVGSRVVLPPVEGP